MGEGGWKKREVKGGEGEGVPREGGDGAALRMGGVGERGDGERVEDEKRG